MIAMIGPCQHPKLVKMEGPIYNPDGKRYHCSDCGEVFKVELAIAGAGQYGTKAKP